MSVCDVSRILMCPSLCVVEPGIIEKCILDSIDWGGKEGPGCGDVFALIIAWSELVCV